MTRHPGAREWASGLGLNPVFASEIDAAAIEPNDVVLGTLPVHLAAAVIARGARYLHLEMTTPIGYRGRELSADEMRQFGARLVPYFVRQVGSTELHSTASPPSATSEPATSPTEQAAPVAAARQAELHPVAVPETAPPTPLETYRMGSVARKLKRVVDDVTHHEGKLVALFVTFLLTMVVPVGIATALENVEYLSLGFFATVVACFLLGAAGVVLIKADQHSGNRLSAPGRQILAALPILKRPGIGEQHVTAFLAVAISVILLVSTNGPTALVAWFGVFSLLFYVLVRLGRKLFSLDIRQFAADDVPRRPVVVLILSKLNGFDQPLERHAGDGQHWVGDALDVRRLNTIMDENGPTGGMTFADACSAGRFPGSPMFSWQQSFRVIDSQFGHDGSRHPKGRLVVIPSEQSDVQFHAFKAAVEALARRSNIELTIEKSGPINIHRLADIEDGIRSAVLSLENCRLSDGKPINYADILIDVTGGLKIASIAAAAATFSSDLYFCYVEGGVVWVFDARAKLGGNIDGA